MLNSKRKTRKLTWFNFVGVVAALCLVANANANERLTPGKTQSEQCGVMVWLDLMPGSCPNILTDRGFYIRDGRLLLPEAEEAAAKAGNGWRRKLVPVVILGGPGALVQNIDTRTISLSGVRCVSAKVVDCAAPPEGEITPFPCCSGLADGYPDLVIEVEKLRLWQACVGAEDGQNMPFTVTGRFYNGEPFMGSDAVTIRYTEQQSTVATEQAPIVSLSECYPNPFNPTTSFNIRFSAPTEYRVEVYNIAGQRVKSEMGYADAGVQTITWDGKDDRGTAVGSGVYFFRVHAGEAVAHRKMTLLK